MQHPPSDTHPRPTRTFADIERAIRAAFALDTCSPDDVPQWSVHNRARGHCVVAALTVHDFFGGDLLCAEVRIDGERTGYHWWNRLHGVDIDLTLEQMSPEEELSAPTIVARPIDPDHRYRKQYELFRGRVEQQLSATGEHVS